MTHKQLQQKLMLQLWAHLREQADKNPYFIFVYDWGIVNQTSYEVPTASQIAQCVISPIAIRCHNL